MGHILWVEPVFKEMIWGGNQLKEKSIEQFVEHYEMVGLVQEETLMRAFQRWRKLVKEEKAIKL